MKLLAPVSRIIVVMVCCLPGARADAAQTQTVVAYVANAGNNNVQLLDVKSGETLNKLYTGTAPWRLVLAPDGKRLIVQHWYAETSAVVNLADNRIEKVLPVRGPAVFNPKGDLLWSQSWPAGQLTAFDAKTFSQTKQIGGEDKNVYDMVFWGKQLAKGQYDPVSKTARKVSDNVLTAKLEDAKALSANTPSGTSPARLVVDPTGDFLLTANFDDNTISIINDLGDGRRITLAHNPRDIVFNKKGKQMIVIAWARNTLGSDIFTLDTDFKQRPWPAIKAHNAKHLRAGLVDAEMGPDGMLYVLDRPGKRLLVIDPDSLKEVKSIPVGDDPMAFVLRQVSAAERTQLAQKTAGRKRLEEIIGKMKAKAVPFKDVSFTEILTQQVPDESKTPVKDKARKEEMAKIETKTVTTVTKSQIKLPDGVRQELANGGVRIGQGGQATFITKDGHYNTTPRQELIHVLYALNTLSVDEIIRQLAGDVPGSLFLRNGIAVDIVSTVEEKGHKFYALGASGRSEPVSQLWVSAETGLPVDLVEQYPVIRTRSPHDAVTSGFQGLTETKLHYHEVGGRMFPVELNRYLDGIDVGVVKITDVVFDKNLPEEKFSLARLGNTVKPFSVSPALAKGKQTGPGLAVASQGTSHVDTSLDAHPKYNTNPPTSGPHTRYMADPGVHKTPLSPEVQVGSLINGTVLLQYACPQDCPELAKQLEDAAAKHEEVIVAPYPLMKSRIALTAWQRIETLKEFDEKRISAFIEAYAGKRHPHNPEDMPETPESEMMPPGHPSMPGAPMMPH